jgi:hypothetical protein
MINAFVKLRCAGFLLTLCFSHLLSSAQDQLPRYNKVFFRSGFGFSLPVAESRTYFKPKFSTSLGGMIFLGKDQLFLYPRLGLNAYSYNQQTGEGLESRILNGRSTTYLLSVDLGYRKTFNRIALYGFAGTGGGIILLPRISEPSGSAITMRNERNNIFLLEGGMGGDYSLGNVLVFIEGTYTQALNKLAGQTYQAIPLNIGFRTNVSKVFYKK